MMIEQIKCPVCGKVGIPDYHKEEVICPCCGTNLSIYKMLMDSRNAQTSQATNDKKWKIATAASAAIAILALLFVCSPKHQDEVNNAGLNNKVAVLNDSINSLTTQLNLANEEITGIIYIVKRNDSPCKISRKLYGTESRYKEIEAFITKPLQPGDTLKLK